MKKTFALLSVCLGIALLSGCSTTQKIDLPQGTSKGYTSYRYYRDGPSNPNFADREDEVHHIIQEQMSKELQAHGLKRSPNDAELVIAYLVVMQDTAVSTAISDYYISSGSDILSEAHRRMGKKNLPGSYEQGALVIDIIDKNTGNLIYRDFAKREKKAYLNLDERNVQVKTAVTEALAAFFK
ncbi:MAG: hypothetical protein ACI8Z5_000211 [Lentimonas sp.]|jgi:hypothetical protein